MGRSALPVALTIAVAVRILAAAVLLFGPWTNEAAELDGWDTARFQAIAEAEGRPWVDHEVEYPPGSVVLIELVAGDDVVATNRVLVGLSLVVDLGLAAGLTLIGRQVGRRHVGTIYLLLGTLMVPAGLLRFDLWVGALGVLATYALWRRKAGTFAIACVAGAMIKIFPVLLIPVALAANRRREAVSAIGLGGLCGLVWLAFAGTDGFEQVLSLRGVTGWHVESIPGSLAVVGGDVARFESDAYRVGELNDAIILIGRLLLLAVVIRLGWSLRARHFSDTRSGERAQLASISLMMVGSLAALLSTAPLLSPQFFLWLTPWVALAGDRRLSWLAASVIGLTALVLATFGPPGLDHPLPAVLLLARDVGLIGMIVVADRTLARPPVE